MPVVDVVNLSGEKVGQVELADAVFGAEVNQNLLHEASRWYLNSLRRGTHKTKEKSEVSGAGRKLWRQKGTGRARIGSIRSPLWRHGGTVHGPRPRSYAYALPKKMLLGALRSALSAKLAEEKLTVVEAWSLDTHKTKTLRLALGKLNAEKTTLLVANGDNRNLELASRNLEGVKLSASNAEKTTLLVANGENRNLELASRNLEGVKLSASNALQPYDVLRHDRLVLSKDAVARLVRALDPDSPTVQAPHVESIAPAPAPKKEAAPKAAAKTTKKPAAAKKPATKKGKE